jgi:uncharacterized protein YjiS (DUF1127 family)
MALGLLRNLELNSTPSVPIKTAPSTLIPTPDEEPSAAPKVAPDSGDWDMVTTTEHGRPACGGSRRPLAALRAWLADVRSQRQRAADRRLLRELPDHLLRDMGLSRAQVGLPADPTTPRVLRDFAAWR